MRVKSQFMPTLGGQSCHMIIIGAYKSFDAFLTFWLANVHVDTACNNIGAS